MSPNAGGEGGGVAGSQPREQLYTGAQRYVGDLTQYLTYDFISSPGVGFSLEPHSMLWHL
jgi:hypothetical protein